MYWVWIVWKAIYAYVTKRLNDLSRLEDCLKVFLRESKKVYSN